MPLLKIINLCKTANICAHSVVAVNKPMITINSCRYVSSHHQRLSQSTLKKEKEKMRTYLVHRYIQFIKKYANVIENSFPTAMRMYRGFSIGLKDFYKDLKTYISLRVRVTRDRGFTNVSRQELELYHKMPKDMWKVAPVLLLAVVPFGNYIVFPLAFMKPRLFLCSHFWSIQQRAEFAILDLKERFKHNRPVFRALQAKLHVIEDENLKQKWIRVVALIGSGQHPTVDEVIVCKDLFSGEPYNLNSIGYWHSGHLLKMHGQRKGLFRKTKLKYLAFLLHEMDKAIMREGGVHNLSTESLRNACHLRGLNSSHLSNKDMISWLDQWLQISNIIDKKSYSLLLHCPILFAYNHPQNWVLIY